MKCFPTKRYFKPWPRFRYDYVANLLGLRFKPAFHDKEENICLSTGIFANFCCKYYYSKTVIEFYASVCLFAQATAHASVTFFSNRRLVVIFDVVTQINTQMERRKRTLSYHIFFFANFCSLVQNGQQNLLSFSVDRTPVIFQTAISLLLFGSYSANKHE